MVTEQERTGKCIGPTDAQQGSIREDNAGSANIHTLPRSVEYIPVANASVHLVVHHDVETLILQRTGTRDAQKRWEFPQLQCLRHESSKDTCRRILKTHLNKGHRSIVSQSQPSCLTYTVGDRIVTLTILELYFKNNSISLGKYYRDSAWVNLATTRQHLTQDTRRIIQILECN